MKVKLIPPVGRQRLWRVVCGPGYFRCDSEEIARLVASRLRRGKPPGWAARDVRAGMTR